MREHFTARDVLMDKFESSLCRTRFFAFFRKCRSRSYTFLFSKDKDNFFIINLISCISYQDNIQLRIFLLNNFRVFPPVHYSVFGSELVNE